MAIIIIDNYYYSGVPRASIPIKYSVYSIYQNTVKNKREIKSANAPRFFTAGNVTHAINDIPQMRNHFELEIHANGRRNLSPDLLPCNGRMAVECAFYSHSILTILLYFNQA